MSAEGTDEKQREDIYAPMAADGIHLKNTTWRVLCFPQNQLFFYTLLPAAVLTMASAPPQVKDSREPCRVRTPSWWIRPSAYTWGETCFI